MIIHAPQYGGRKRSSGSIQQRVAQQLEQSRRDRQAGCDHNFVRSSTEKCAARVCTKCGATRSY